MRLKRETTRRAKPSTLGQVNGQTQPSVLARCMSAAKEGLVQVIVGRDPRPAWTTIGRRRVATVLAGVAVVLLVVGVLVVLLSPRHSAGSLSLTLMLPLFMAPIALLPRYPLLAWRIGYLTALVVPFIHGEPRLDLTQLGVLELSFCVAGLRYGRPALWTMWALMLPPVWLWLGPLWGRLSVTIGLTVVAIAVDAVGAWERARSAFAAQAERANTERDRRTVLEERARIAREMHDVVAHHMSMIAVQAETAQFRLADLPASARAEFDALSAAARDAMKEMRSLLGVLRDDRPAERIPQPQLSDLSELVAMAEHSGARVKMSLSTTTDSVPPNVGVCLYRIAQEALTNASRHSPGSAISITLDRLEDKMLLRISNDRGSSVGPEKKHPEGHGLVGMRERVAALGGSLSAGPTAEGGFIVTATLKCDAVGPKGAS